MPELILQDSARQNKGRRELSLEPSLENEPLLDLWIILNFEKQAQ
jgi:hypothetical protein